MKETMKKQLIKDIVIAIIAWVIAAIVFIGLAENSVGLGILMGFMCAGIPFFNNNPHKLPMITATVFTITPNISASNL